MTPVAFIEKWRRDTAANDHNALGDVPFRPGGHMPRALVAVQSLDEVE